MTVVKIRRVKERTEAAVSCGGREVEYPTIAPEFRICDRCEGGPTEHHSTPSPTPAAQPGDLEAWNAYLAKWSITYPVCATFAAYLDGDDYDYRYIRIQLVTHGAPDSRDPSKIKRSDDSVGLLAPSRLPDPETPRWIRSLLRYHVSHELDEFLMFDGSRVFEPHDRRPAFCDDEDCPE